MLACAVGRDSLVSSSHRDQREATEMERLRSDPAAVLEFRAFHITGEYVRHGPLILAYLALL